MTRLKKMMALVIAMVMVICTMSFSAFADNTTATGNVTADPTITVMGLEEGDVAHFYQVLAWEAADETHKGGWVFVDPFTGMKDKDGNDITVETLAGNPAADPKVPMGITSSIAGIIARKASGEGTAVTAASGSASLTIDGTTNTSGLYLVLITPGDADTVYNPVFVSSDYKPDAQQTDPSSSFEIATSASSYSDSAAAKRSKLGGEKEEDDDIQSPEVGKTLNFTAKSTIPGYGEVYEKPFFEFTDKMNALKLVKGSVKIVEPADAVATIKEEDTQYTITFDETYLKTIKAPTAVKVTYQAIVTTDAVQGVNQEDNTIIIKYSHNPNDESDYNVKKDTTEHYTFTIGADVLFDSESAIGKSTTEIVKVGVDSAGKPITETKTESQITAGAAQQGPLEGAHFKLYTDADCKIEYIPKDAEGNDIAPLDIVSGADGRMTIPGLAAGDYWIKEVSAPEGFIRDDKAHHIKITATLKEVEVTEWFKNDVWYDHKVDGAKEVTYKTNVLQKYVVEYDGVEAASHTFSNPGNSIAVVWEEEESHETPSSLTNTAGVELPATGGIGTTIFYAIGTILVLGAGILLVTRRRMEAR